MMVINERAEERAVETDDGNENNPSTTGAGSEAEMDEPEAHKRGKGSSYDLGQKYFRQQKWNKVPPWLRSRGGGDIGDKSRGEVCSTEIRTVHRMDPC